MAVAKKRQLSTKFQRKKARAEAMSLNPAIRNRIGAPPCINPNRPRPFKLYNEESMVERMNPVIVDRCTPTIQHNLSAKEQRRAEARTKKMLLDQAERLRLMESLKEKLVDSNWQELIEGGTDNKVQGSVSSHDRDHVLKQARAVCRALEIRQQAQEDNSPIAWVKGCCQRASEELSIATGKTIARWYLEFHQGEDSEHCIVVERFPRSLKGRLNRKSARNAQRSNHDEEKDGVV